MVNRKRWSVFAIILLVIVACQKSEDLNFEEFIGFRKPTHFPDPVYNFATTPLTKETVELGRKLFYDERLSRNNTISCASCHISQNAFTHHGHDVSHGIDDKLGIRNAPTLANLAWATSFFWDGGVPQLDLVSLAPIVNEVEMDENMNNILVKLKADAKYPDMFTKAFGKSEFSGNEVLKALAHFMTTLVSDNSKYDKVKRGEDSFTEEEEKGYQLFLAKCNSCHTEPLFTDYSFRDNGLGINPANDLGRFEVTLNEKDKLRFKVPTLRNLSYTAPYMHDGRFYTLHAVLNHYAKEVVLTDNLDPLLRVNKGIPLTKEEMEALLSFLKTLDDESFIQNKNFIQP